MGGALSGRRIEAHAGQSTRPTSERAREAIASALQARELIADRRVLDLFCGSGAMALEAISRGAKVATLVDSDRGVIKLAERNARALALHERVKLLAIDLEHPERLVRALGDAAFDLVFLDPPYARIEIVTALLDALWSAQRLEPGAAIVIEHARRAPPTLPQDFCEVSTYRYGDTAVVLARAPEERR